MHVVVLIQFIMRLLIARCQGPESPSKLEVFAIEGENKSVGSKLQEFSFVEAKDIYEESSNEDKQSITVKMQEGDDLTFYAKSEVEHKRWFIYCYVLAHIPTYPIPDISHYHIPLDSFKQPQIDSKKSNIGKSPINPVSSLPVDWV